LKRKKFVVVALLSSSLALTGCSFAPPASLIPYAPSDGTQIDVADLRARNFLIIKGDADRSMLIGSVANTVDRDKEFTIQLFDIDGNRITESFEVGPLGKTDIGYNGNPGIIIDIDAKPGQYYSVYFGQGTDNQELIVPVLDGTLEEYRDIYESLKN
jgi:hypothetical protein